jgi:ribose 1,5-bisphosphokinase PhnN
MVEGSKAPDDTIDRTLQMLEKAAAAMAQGAEHCRVAQSHFMNREWARAAAHSWAAHGHLVEARQNLDSLATDFASRSKPVI